MTVIQYLEEILALSLANSVKLDQVMRSSTTSNRTSWLKP